MGKVPNWCRRMPDIYLIMQISDGLPLKFQVSFVTEAPRHFFLHGYTVKFKV